ncbi:MAG: hypothetical protein LBQ66_07740 [Planctomycetaceae bacterium]|jgi:hypothetical protein|nr:hypothetical protein [Planctomycetaceae bacterium]
MTKQKASIRTNDSLNFGSPSWRQPNEVAALDNAAMRAKPDTIAASVCSSISAIVQNNSTSTKSNSNTITARIIHGGDVKTESGVQHFKEGISMNQDINVLALVKGEERYIFLYSDTNRAETLRTLGRYASNPDLSFTWYDAAVLSQKIRQESQQLAREQQQSQQLLHDQQQQQSCIYNSPRYNIYSKTAEEIE